MVGTRDEVVVVKMHRYIRRLNILANRIFGFGVLLGQKDDLTIEELRKGKPKSNRRALVAYTIGVVLVAIGLFILGVLVYALRYGLEVPDRGYVYCGVLVFAGFVFIFKDKLKWW